MDVRDASSCRHTFKSSFYFSLLKSFITSEELCIFADDFGEEEVGQSRGAEA